jgi:hypothetical protein
MNLQDCVETVEKILLQNKRRFKDSHEQMLYERGYLTGLIAKIMMEEPRVRNDLHKRSSKK